MSCSQFYVEQNLKWNEVRRKCMRQNVRELALDGLIQVEKVVHIATYF